MRRGCLSSELDSTSVTKDKREEDREDPQRPRRNQGGRWAGGGGPAKGRVRGVVGAGPGRGPERAAVVVPAPAVEAQQRRVGECDARVEWGCCFGRLAGRRWSPAGFFFSFSFFELNSFLSPERKLPWLCSGASPGVAGAAAARRGWGWASSPLSARVP